MKISIMVILLLGFLSGCTTHTQYVPAACATVHIPPKPRLAIQDIKTGDSPDKIHKAVWLTIVELNNDNDGLRRLLAPYSM